VACWSVDGLPRIGRWLDDELRELHQVVRPGASVWAADVLAVGPLVLSIASLATADGVEVLVLSGSLELVD
jgi:hypothetical protein